MKNAVLLFLVGTLIGVVGCRGDEARCEDMCATFDDCEGVSVDQDDCVSECVSDAENADDNCVEAFETLADCASDMNLDCEDFVDDCEDELEDFTDDCDDDFEDTAAEIIIPVK